MLHERAATDNLIRSPCCTTGMRAIANVRVCCIAFAILAAGETLAAAWGLHEHHLASRLFGICGVALFGIVAAPSIVEAAQNRPRVMVAVGAVVGLVSLTALALVLDPEHILRVLAEAFRDYYLA